MIQIEFANRAKKILAKDQNVIGLLVGGSWLSDELDEFSDLDLILVTDEKVSHQKSKMLDYARRLGTLLEGFTGEHVGEPRVLICLYDEPLLHVDIKFVTLEEMEDRVEDPHILFDRDNQLLNTLQKSEATFPYPDFQWIEDRFWTWVHYALLKIGRGEYLEAFDFLGFLRMTVFGPLLHIKNGNLPRGVRKLETEINPEDFRSIKRTIPGYDKKTLLSSLKNSVSLYIQLRAALYDNTVVQNSQLEEKVMHYFEQIEEG